MSTPNKQNRKKGRVNRGTATKRAPLRRRTQSQHLHLVSRVETKITLKSAPKLRERYPIPISDLFNEDSVGADTEIRLIGYDLSLTAATGNNTSTVAANISHAGPWVRQAASMDGFNQQFAVRKLTRNGTVRFRKRVLPRSEREYLSPHKDNTNTIVLQIDDQCGVVPGATIAITAVLHFIRPHVPTKLANATSAAVDLYEDQDVDTNAKPAPPSVVRDIPLQIDDNSLKFETTDTVSPFVYKFYGHTSFRVRDQFTVTINTTPVNIVGEFYYDSSRSSELQADYTKDGYEGTIVLTRN